MFKPVSIIANNKISKNKEAVDCIHRKPQIWHIVISTGVNYNKNVKIFLHEPKNRELMML